MIRSFRDCFGLGLFVAACSGTPDASSIESGGSGAGAGPGSGGTPSIIVPMAGTGGSGGGAPYALPPGYEPTNFGGMKLGEPVPADGSTPVGTGGSGGGSGCGTAILGVVRDFKRGDRAGGHPDFETYGGQGEKGIVLDELVDQKPAHGLSDYQFTTSAEDFRQWYLDVPDVNLQYFIYFFLEPNNGVLTFFSDQFFPLDGAGFGNEDFDHNFNFTTEVHTNFHYKGGESFSFTGDDDLWVFINRRLAIDLGGLHSPQSMTIELDEHADDLGIAVGNDYPIELFHAERHTAESNFRIDTNLTFIDCGVIVPDPH